MSEHGTGTGTRIRTGTGTGTKLEMVILRSVLVIPEFECGTKFRESWESVWSCDSSASRADEFWGGTSARGVTGVVTGSELAEVCQQSHVSVTGRNIAQPCATCATLSVSHLAGGPGTWGSQASFLQSMSVLWCANAFPISPQCLHVYLFPIPTQRPIVWAHVPYFHPHLLRPMQTAALVTGTSRTPSW